MVTKTSYLPAILSISDLKPFLFDAYGNHLIESVVRVFFPAMKDLEQTLKSLKEEHLKAEWSSHLISKTDKPIPLAIQVISDFAAPKVMDMVLQHLKSLPPKESSCPEKVLLKDLEQIFVVISDISQTKNSSNDPIVEAVLCVILAESKTAETLQSLRETDPHMVIETRMPIQTEDPLPLTDSFPQASKEDLQNSVSSLGSSSPFIEEYFPSTTLSRSAST